MGRRKKRPKKCLYCSGKKGHMIMPLTDYGRDVLLALRTGQPIPEADGRKIWKEAVFKACLRCDGTGLRPETRSES